MFSKYHINFVLDEMRNKKRKKENPKTIKKKIGKILKLEKIMVIKKIKIKISEFKDARSPFYDT